MDLSTTTAPDSTQVNAEDFLAGPRTVTITGVRTGTAEQPVNIDLAEYPDRAYRPGKSMRRVLVAAWGADSAAYIGRRLTLFNDPNISFGRERTGGIRIQAMSHISKPLTLALTVTRGKRAPYVVQPLAEEAARPTFPREHFIDRAREAKTLDVWREVWTDAKTAGVLDEAMKAALQPFGEALKAPAAVEDEPTLDWPETPAPGSAA